MSSIRGDLIVSRNTSTRSLRVETEVVATSASTLNLTVFSKSQQIFTGSTSGQVVKLPNSTILEVGHMFWLRNRASVSIEIVDSTGGHIADIFPYQTIFLSLQNGQWAWSFEKELLQDSIQTSDDSPTQAQTISIPTNSVMVLETKVLGVRTDGLAGTVGDSASYHRIVRLKNIAGTLTMYNLQTIYTSEDQPAWNATFLLKGTDVQVMVLGSANNTVSWNISTQVELTAF